MQNSRRPRRPATRQLRLRLFSSDRPFLRRDPSAVRAGRGTGLMVDFPTPLFSGLGTLGKRLARELMRKFHEPMPVVVMVTIEIERVPARVLHRLVLGIHPR